MLDASKPEQLRHHLLFCDASATRHASIRAQQRGVPPFIVTLLQIYGLEEHDKRGGVLRFLNRRSRKDIARDLGGAVVGALDRYLNAYIVDSTDGPLITVGWRYRKVRHV